ncbi:MAG: hypothetical protein NC313_12385 [Butyrivibrio sp.]|nr:hypothetical protein [Butyrivibrio sp.]
MTREIEKEEDEMFDYGDYIEEMGIQKGRLEGKREGRLEGRREGKREGETMLATLLNLLFADGRTEDAKKAAADTAERNKLYKEYGIV